jgi:glycine oxidase
MSRSIGIAGAGVLGRMLALAFHRRGWAVTLFDRETRTTSGDPVPDTGLIDPYLSLTRDTRAVALLGEYATEQWPAWIETLPAPVHFVENGALAVAHPRDAVLLASRLETLANLAPLDDIVTDCAAPDVAHLEPALAGRFARGLFFPLEQHLDPCSLRRALAAAIEAAGIAWIEACPVERVEPRRITSAHGAFEYTWVVDARGRTTDAEVSDLRVMRHERVRVHAPGIALARPVRIMHPREEITVVPQGNDRYVIGSIASDTDPAAPITARALLELLSAAHTIHPGFGDATLLAARAVAVPMLSGGLPRLIPDQGLLSVQGAAAHPWKTLPAVVDIAVSFIDTGEVHPMADGLMETWTL